MFMQETIVYADVGPLSTNRSQSPRPGNTPSLDFDQHRVEYAQLNHKAVVSAPVEESTNINEGIMIAMVWY